MIEALIAAVIYCAAILLVAWLLTILIGLIPVPPPIAGVLPTIIWVVAIICCLFVLLGVVRGGLPPLMLTGVML